MDSWSSRAVKPPPNFLRFFPRRPSRPSLSKDQAHVRLSHRMVVAQLVGKGSLGLGFIASIFGVTDHKSWALRTGLALLLMGMIASFASLVHSFKRRRLAHQSASDPAHAPKRRPPDPS
jgi:hypothetical protein